MKIRLFLTFLISIVVCGFVYSQESQEVVKQDLYANPESIENQLYLRSMKKEESNDLEAQILYEYWQQARIYHSDDDYIEVDSCNVNIKLEEVLVVNDGVLNFVRLDQIIKVEFVDKGEFVQYNYLTKKNDVNSGIFEVLVDGDLKLLKKYYILEQRVSDNPLVASKVYDVKFVRSSKLYYFSTKAGVQEMPSAKSELIKIFGRQKNVMQKYATENKLKNRKEEDLTRLFSYYNSQL